jgi:hypothetical protein
MKQSSINMRSFLTKLWNNLTIPGEILADSKYLSQATDTADLERRMRDLQRAETRLRLHL